MKKLSGNVLILAIVTFFCLSVPAFAQDSEAELAKKLSNPVASLISVPIQANYDKNFNADEQGSVWRINIQPVIPITLNEKWNLISRTILPIILPTASEDVLGGEKWGIGPTAVVLKQAGPWTYGALVNHIESFAGEDSRADISASFVQPFVSYITKTKTTIGLNTESTYDWESEQWSVPVNLTVSQMLKVGDQIFQIGGGVRYWADSTAAGPEDWGARLQLTFLFPK